MTYRGTMPPGPVYDGQGQQHPQHPQYQQPRAPPLHPQYANPYPNGTHGTHGSHGNPQYQHAQYPQHSQHPQQPQQPQHPQHSQPSYPQQPQQQPPPFYPVAAAPQFPSYDGTYDRPPPSNAPPVQFVDPSFLQRAPPLTQPAYIPPPLPPASQPSQPAAATMPPQQPHVVHQPQPQQTPSVKDSPRLEERRPPSQAGPGKLSTKDSRRLTSSGGVAKSPTLSQAASHLETLPLLLCVAEDCFAKASSEAQDVARSMAGDDVAEHHKLLATGLGCLEIAMKSNKLWPRLEARLCMRYASILVEETTNIMEAETALTRGIAVCDKHRFLDLKYGSQFLLMKTLFQRSQKAAFKSLDTHISDCTTYKHIHWMYAFRFLKAAFHLQSGTPSDHHALENLRKIAAIANQRDDKAIFVMAVLLEGLAHLSSMKDDWITRVQTCIAQASKLQLDDAVHLPQIDILLLLLDLACSLHQKSAQISSQKLSALQTRLEELRHSPEWAALSDEIALPVKRIPNMPPTISHDTRAILRPGEDGLDYLVLSTLGKQEVFALAYVLHGIVALHKASTLGRSSSIWNEAVRLLEENKPMSTLQSLPEALRQADWAKELICYAHILVGLQAATLSDWAKVKKCLDMIQDAQPPAGFLDIMTLYLTGVFLQGSAKLSEAVDVWKDAKFQLDWNGEPKAARSHIESELSILAALNRIWILHAPACRDESEMANLVDQLRPLCEDNPDPEIRTAYNLVLASVTLSPPLTLSIQQVKRHIQQAFSGSQATSNTQCLSMALNIMRCRLFENVVGEQAVKSAKAGSAQAKKSGNLLWMSVADGMLAQSHEILGALAEARAARESGVRLANEAFQKTRV